MLEHFVTAQHPIYETALAELRAGDKRTHWMWFIFPQLRALGRSEHAIRYGLADLSEAKAYLAHTVLGPRLRECTHAMLGIEGRSAHDILHAPDDLKFRSSMTLFLHAAADPKPFRAALDKYYGGVPDPLTVELLGPDA
jgi:uncharacterized protein (DUF1810 family)